MSFVKCASLSLLCPQILCKEGVSASFEFRLFKLLGAQFSLCCSKKNAFQAS